MTHASLCKRTYKQSRRFHRTDSLGMGRMVAVGKMRSIGIAASLFVAFAGALSAQISPTSVPNATVGTAYSVQLTETESFGVAPVAWGITSGSLPSGLTLNTNTTATTTTISGTPTTAGNYSFVVSAEYNESAPTVNTQGYTIQVAANCTPVFSPASPLPPET